MFPIINHISRRAAFPLAIFGLLLLFPPVLFAQHSSEPQKYALVIGNGAYSHLTSLANPVNDANDVTEALVKLGFTVEKVINGNLAQMDSAVIQLKNRLSVSKGAYGFFFYAGHGVQSSGENYLIPSDANIPSANFLRSRAMSVQAMMDEINDAGNSLNVMVLDACRDNPFGWGRSGSRGLAVISHQPADSIIVYATSAGQQASDGLGRNGLFTSHLLPNLTTPGLEVAEIFRRTGADVAEASNRSQIPAVYNQFFGTAYLGERPIVRPPSVFEAGAANIATGSLEISTVTAGTLQITGAGVDQQVEIPAWGSLPIEKINAGVYRVVMRYEDGQMEERAVEVGRSQAASLEFAYRPIPVPAAPAPQVSASKPARLNTLGFSLGTSIPAPGFTGTVYGTITPWERSFFEIGFDAGVGDYAAADVTHFSIYPYIRYALFVPFAKKTGAGWHLGAGTGLMMMTYTFSEGSLSKNVLVLDISTGFRFASGFTITNSLRTDFSGVSNKIAVGYSYRF